MEATKIENTPRRFEESAGITKAVTPRPSGGRLQIGELARFFAVIAQFGLIVLLVDDWQLESQSLARVMELAFIGFIIHHLLAPRFRLSFFSLLSLVAVVTSVGHLGPNVWIAWLTGKMPTNAFLYRLVPGFTLVGIGLGLIGICHLPIRFGARVGLLAIVAAALAYRPEASHCAFQPLTRRLIFLSPTECLFSVVSGGGLQDLLLNLLQRRVVACLPDGTQVDVPRSISATFISNNIPVFSAGCLQVNVCPRCGRMHRWHVSIIPAHLRDLSFDCGFAAHVWL